MSNKFKKSDKKNNFFVIWGRGCKPPVPPPPPYLRHCNIKYMKFIHSELLLSINRMKTVLTLKLFIKPSGCRLFCYIFVAQKLILLTVE